MDLQVTWQRQEIVTKPGARQPRDIKDSANRNPNMDGVKKKVTTWNHSHLTVHLSPLHSTILLLLSLRFSHTFVVMASTTFHSRLSTTQSPAAVTRSSSSLRQITGNSLTWSRAFAPDRLLSAVSHSSLRGSIQYLIVLIHLLVNCYCNNVAQFLIF